jgi:hypothetical protein
VRPGGTVLSLILSRWRRRMNRESLYFAHFMRRVCGGGPPREGLI